jgi:hypothetical protein
MAPVVKEAGRDALRHTVEGTLITGATLGVGIIGTLLFLIGQDTVRLVKRLPRPTVRITWDRSWTETPRAATAAPGAKFEPESLGPTFDGTATAAA